MTQSLFGSHHYTARAKKRILEVFPSTTLPMEEEERKFKYGQLDYGNYVYPKETLQEMDSLFRRELEKIFPGSRVDYLMFSPFHYMNNNGNKLIS